MAVTERSFVLYPKKGEGQPHFFGRRLPRGTVVTVYEVEIGGRVWSFETAADAEAFDGAAWPKPFQGGWLTSDGVRFPDAKKHKAEARQSNLNGGA